VSIPTPLNPDAAPAHVDEIELLEFDETIPPRPEEDVADAARAAPDRTGHGSAAPDSAAAASPPESSRDEGNLTAR
jgi:hypothetical protein